MSQKNLDLIIDFRSDLPIYTQIVEQVRRLVASGSLSPGDQLPTVRQLATDLRVNFNTVARAYRILDEAGLISTQQGRGTYIWETPSLETSARLQRQVLQELTRQFLAQAARLGFSEQEVLESLLEAVEEERGTRKAERGMEEET